MEPDTAEDTLNLNAIFAPATPKVIVPEVPRIFIERENLIAIDGILATLIEIKGLNDIWMTPQEQVRVRVFGKVSIMEEMPAIKQTDFDLWVKKVHPHTYEYNFDASYALSLKDRQVRFRVNVYRSLNGWRACLRLINDKVPPYSKLGLTDSVAKAFMDVPDGLIFFSGVTGSGKSSSISSLLVERSLIKPEHILTLEDPVEYEFKDARAFFSQRELGRDFTSFHEGLKNALREAPNTVFIGEIRDAETAEIALHAAETGHLVVSTLHTRRAHQGVDRFALMFPDGQRDEVYKLLASTLRLIVCQRLIASKDNQRVALLEVMHNTSNIRPLIAQKKIPAIYSALAYGGDRDNFTFEMHLKKLYETGAITSNTYQEVLASFEDKEVTK